MQKYEIAGAAVRAGVSLDELRRLVELGILGRAPANRHLTYRVLRSFANWALRRGLLEVKPMNGVSAPRYDPTPSGRVRRGRRGPAPHLRAGPQPTGPTAVP